MTCGVPQGSILGPLVHRHHWMIPLAWIINNNRFAAIITQMTHTCGCVSIVSSKKTKKQKQNRSQCLWR